MYVNESLSQQNTPPTTPEALNEPPFLKRFLFQDRSHLFEANSFSSFFKSAIAKTGSVHT